MAIFTPENVRCSNCGVSEQVSEAEMRERFRGAPARTECRFCERMGERSMVRMVRMSAQRQEVR